MESLFRYLSIKTRRIFFFLLACIVFLSCSKDKDVPGDASTELPAGTVYFNSINNADTISFYNMQVLKDSAETLSFSASVKNRISGSHVVTFMIDSSAMSVYRAKYGNNDSLLHSSNYFSFLNTGTLTADSLTSTSAEVNIVRQSTLTPLNTYVLPVRIESVDGSTAAIDTSKSLLFLKIHTGAIPYISKTNWTIVSFSSAYLSGTIVAVVAAPQNLIDNSLATRWISDFGFPMPQYVVINMAQSYPLIGVTYTTAADPYASGYPTQINVQLSVDGTSWQDMGNYSDPNISTTQVTRIFNFKTTVARYIKFTVLAAQPRLSSPTSSPVLSTQIGDIEALHE